MKTYIFAITLSGLSILAASAQDKNRNDGTYSTHNYKHPNKAAVAKQWANQKGAGVSAPGLDNRTVANYKQPVPSTPPADGYVVPHKPQENLAGRNYKMQRVQVTEAPGPQDEIATHPRPVLPVEND
ncbi:hypothetical protein GCM10027299_44830 [Larkinella ripae]